jgi:branched-chain amino acid transport system ATP-binding protein
MPLLEVKNLSVRYDKAQILNGVSLSVDAGEFVGLVGPNGAGKSTLLRALSGLVRFEERMKRGTTGDIVLEGEVRFAGERIDALPSHEVRMRGLVHCPERRRPFRELTVLENLWLGHSYQKTKARRSGGWITASRSFPDCPKGKRRLPARSQAASSRCSPLRAR